MSWLLYGCGVLLASLCENILRGPTGIFAVCGQYVFLVVFVFAEKKKALARTVAFFCAGFLADLFFSPYPGTATVSFTLCGIALDYLPHFPRQAVILRMLAFGVLLLGTMGFWGILCGKGLGVFFSVGVYLELLPVVLVYPACRLFWPVEQTGRKAFLR